MLSFALEGAVTAIPRCRRPRRQRHIRTTPTAFPARASYYGLWNSVSYGYDSFWASVSDSFLTRTFASSNAARMWGALSRRTRLFGSALRQWKSVAVLTIGLISVGQCYRDEFLEPAEAGRYVGRALLDRYLPDWPWEWGAIATLVGFVFVLFEGLYRIAAAREMEIERLNERRNPTLELDYVDSPSFNEITSPSGYGEPLLCRLYRVRVGNRSDTTARNVRVIIKGLIFLNTGEPVTYVLGKALTSTAAGLEHFDLAPGGDERVDVVFCKDSKCQHGTHFQFKIRDNDIGICLRGSNPPVTIWKEPHLMTLEAQGDDLTPVMRSFLLSVTDNGDLLFRAAL